MLFRLLGALSRSAASSWCFPARPRNSYRVAARGLPGYGQVAVAVRRGGVMAEASMRGHTAIVTCANHGIGAATALALGQRGCAVLCTFLRIDDPADPEHRKPIGTAAGKTPVLSPPRSGPLGDRP
jgi:hypothetical protein